MSNYNRELPMSFDKDVLKKLAHSVKKDGVTSSTGRELRKMAASMRIAYLTAFIKKSV
jgi:hypothetical protein